MTQETNPAGLFVAFDEETHKPGHYWFQHEHDGKLRHFMAVLYPNGEVIGRSLENGFLSSFDLSKALKFGPAIPAPAELAAMQRDSEAMRALERMLIESSVRLCGREWAGLPLYFVNTGEKTGMAGGWDTEHQGDTLADAILARAVLAALESAGGAK